MASFLVDGLRLPVAVSGHAALELCNTRAGWGSDTPKEYLQSYPHLAVWARETGLISGDDCTLALRAAPRRPAYAAGVVTRAIAFREALCAQLTGTGSEAGWAAINLEATGAATAMRLRPPPGRDGSGTVAPPVPMAVWELAPGDALDTPLLAAAWSATTLLTTASADTVRACPGGGCGWLFHDPRGRRRWCAMAWCGNRAKVRRHAQRARPHPAGARVEPAGGSQPPR